ncbi:MAG: phytanoyl-CoA dioxygenase family protein [Flavobacteriaceae bacterium]|jgi:ectoine hydroxylase|nr:phytanoyl-CoA dioxygenase family protein [Flavobacteriaceae bacterium]MBT6354506.1 phytanoyl-CoA dioxygenase family protein [Pelagibacteraceae bacterium]
MTQKNFNKDGFILKKNLFSEIEINKLKEFIKTSSEKENNARQTKSSSGKLSITLWNDPSDDLFGKFSTNERIVKPMEEYLDDEVYHYHSKIIWKKPGDGGFDWHQDYGYWYHNACLYPDMASCFIMLDKATKENGCLKVLKGSHRVGRIGHGISDTPEQTADMERINELEKRHECVYITADPGDALFFHANLLHSSDANKSKDSRRTLIVCFNTKSNNPYKESGHASYTRLKVSSSNTIMEYKID